MSKAAKAANFWGYGIGGLAGQKLVSKGAKGANFEGPGSGTLGQKLVTLTPPHSGTLENTSWHPYHTIWHP